MDPRDPSCPNPRCPARGQAAQDNIKVHSYAERRFRCTSCRTTCAASRGTPFYRLHKDPALLVCVVPPLAYGCPTQAIVAAFGRDEPRSPTGKTRPGGMFGMSITISSPPAPSTSDMCKPTRSTARPPVAAAGWPWLWPCRIGSGWVGSSARALKVD
jgi:hypothetical protein